MHVTIIGTTTCPYCVNAKDLAKEKGYEIHYLTIIKEERPLGQNEITMEDAFKIVGKPFRTVPQIIVENEHVGGFDDFSKYVRNKDIDGQDFSDVEL